MLSRSPDPQFQSHVDCALPPVIQIPHLIDGDHKAWSPNWRCLSAISDPASDQDDSVATDPKDLCFLMEIITHKWHFPPREFLIIEKIPKNANINVENCRLLDKLAIKIMMNFHIFVHIPYGVIDRTKN